MADNKLKVYTLGRFKIEVGNRELREKDWKSAKTLKLFKLLLINYNKEINVEQILEKIWPSTSFSKGVKRVYDTIYQLRQVLDNVEEESYISKSAYGYSLNENKSYSFDWNIFSDIYEKYKQNIDLQDLAKDELYQAIDELEYAMNLYQGDFMENDLYEQWIELPRIQYREKMLDIIMLLAKSFYRLHNNDKALEYLELGIKEESYREDFYLLAMKILRQENRCWKVASLYKKCKQAMKEELGISPSERLEAEYNKLNQNQHCSNHKPQTNLSSLGALRCNSDSFKEIYKLEQRKMMRENSSSLLLKIKFEEVFSKQLLEELIIRISSRLRSEDVITNWDSKTIYILLAQASLGNNIKISHRIFDSLFLTKVGSNPQLLWKEISKEKINQEQGLIL